MGGSILGQKHYKEINHLKNLSEGHILYFSENVEEYINNVVDFVMSGLEQNQYSIIIENDRISPLVKKRLTSMLKESDLNKVKFINNYYFYYVKGDFQCNSIFDFLPKLIENYTEQEFSVRSWAHVEWGDEQEVHNKLVASEKDADVIVSEKRLLSVCAYDSDRVSEELKRNLLTRHNFLMNDQGDRQEEMNISVNS